MLDNGNGGCKRTVRAVWTKAPFNFIHRVLPWRSNDKTHPCSVVNLSSVRYQTPYRWVPCHRISPYYQWLMITFKMNILMRDKLMCMCMRQARKSQGRKGSFTRKKINQINQHSMMCICSPKPHNITISYVIGGPVKIIHNSFDTRSVCALFNYSNRTHTHSNTKKVNTLSIDPWMLFAVH